jgi:hypothetical protein
MFWERGLFPLQVVNYLLSTSSGKQEDPFLRFSLTQSPFSSKAWPNSNGGPCTRKLLPWISDQLSSNSPRNIVNDRSAVYYTTGISKTDPFTNLDNLKVNYLKGYEDVILDPEAPVEPSEPEESDLTYYGRFVRGSQTMIGRLPFLMAMILFVPIGCLAFLVNSAIQSLRSTRRIRLHERGLAGIQPGNYRVPLLITGMREAVEDVYENLNSAQSHEYLDSGIDEDDEIDDGPSSPRLERTLTASTLPDEEKPEPRTDAPTLALAPYQFRMISALDDVGFRKYPVFIHKNRHSHAAIISRMDKPAYDEGKIVFRHWLDEEFIL